MAWVKFIILVTLVISSKLYRGDVINTPSVPVFKDLDSVNYNIDKLFKAIKDKYIPTTIISVKWQKVYSSTEIMGGQYKII